MPYFNKYKALTSSKVNGLSLSKRKGRLRLTNRSNAGTSHTILDDTQNYKESLKSRGCSSLSTVSCGSISPSTGRLSQFDEKKGSNPPSVQASLVEVVPYVEPEETCEPNEGIILVSKSGYYIIFINYNDPILTTSKFLGTSEEKECLINSIGHIEWINVPNLRSNCNPSRWAYEEGIRKHAMPQDYNIWTSMPFIESVLLDGGSNNFAADFVHIAHYGYSMPSCFGAGAKMGGIAVNGDTYFFSKNELVLSIEGTDWVNYDAPIWDFPYYQGAIGNKGVRIFSGLDKEVSCAPLAANEVDMVQRFIETLNHDRYCVKIVEELEFYPQLSEVCQTYANKMAQYDFIAHNDPFTGESSSDRVTAAGIEYEVVTETLATFSVPVDTENELFDAIDGLWDTLKSSEVHYTALTSPTFYHVGFGYAKSEVTSAYYGCCLLLKKIDDQPDELDTYKISYIDPPHIDGTDDPTLYNVVWDRGSGLRAICTAPSEDLSISGLLRATFEGEILIFQQIPVRIKDYKAYDWACIGITKDEAGVVHKDNEYVDTENPHIYGQSLLSTGAFVRPRYINEWISFWIQRDLTPQGSYNYSKDVRVELEGVRGTEYPDLIDAAEDRQYMRVSPLLQEDEEEPDPGPATYGNCKLYVGSTLIDEAHRFSQGSTINPWQNIMVGSLFYTVSGYTAITYAITRCLESTYKKWDDSQNDEVRELYWWLKTEYYAAIVDPLGDVICRWRVKCAPPDYSKEEDNYIPLSREYISDATQQYDFQFSGAIRPSSITIVTRIQDQSFVLTDLGDGELFEVPNQIDGYETILADSVIIYTSGAISLTFGPAYPADEEQILVTLEVRDSEPTEYLETYQEVVQYEDNDEQYNPYQISFEGTHPVFPNLTVSEDGSYAVFSCRNCWVGFNAAPRLGYGDDMLLTDASVFTNQYGSAGIQIQVFDLTNITLSNEPTILSEPLFLNDSGGDTLLLE